MKTLNNVLLWVGIILLAYAYFWCYQGSEAIEVRVDSNLMPALAGWALTVMGYLGRLLSPPPERKD